MTSSTILQRVEQRSTAAAERLTGTITMRAQVRSTEVEETRADGGLVLAGYAAVFESDSEPIGGVFTERLKRGAFRKALAAQPDVRLMINHEGLSLARSTNGTLSMKEDAKGLLFRADLNPDAQLSRDLHALVTRGDMDQMSFAFTVRSDEWVTCDCAEMCECVWERTIGEIGELFELSVVTFPAYRATIVEPREVEPVQGRDGGGEIQTVTSSDAPQASSTPSVVDATNHRRRRAIAASLRTR
jgi:HK97 family phage prohead protease